MTNEPRHSFMAREMAEQPEALERLVARASSLGALASRIAPRPLAGCAIVARGSSDHAALVGRYLFEVATGRPVSLVSPSVHTLYRAKVDCSGMLVLGVSQSGATPEIVEVLARLRAAGGRTVALTDDPTSPLAAVAEEVVNLDVGPERAVPATKTVTATMLACILLAEGLANHRLVSPDALDALPEAVAAILADDSAATAVAMQIDGTLRMTDAADADLPLPAHIPEPLAGIAAVVRGQQLAFSVPTRLGIDPDQPLGLHKVTQT
jgi:glutamine---fructose-6-phosphate transaminase (isomerizing)